MRLFTRLAETAGASVTVLRTSQADLPGVLGGPGINIIPEDEDEPNNQWSEHPR